MKEERDEIIRRIILNVKIILDQEQFFGTLDYCGKNIFKDLKADVDKYEELIHKERKKDALSSPFAIGIKEIK